MKIYFTAAISHVTPETRDNYKKIITIIQKLGHTVVDTHVEEKDQRTISEQTEKEAIAVQTKLNKYRKQAALVVVEASTPSFGVGQEIASALTDNQQVMVLYLKGKKPNILTYQGRDLLYLVEYTPETLKAQLTEYVEFAKTNSDTRFNFFISPRIGSYLDWVSHKKKLPRAVYLRKLIEEDMEHNGDYEGK